MPSPAVTCSEGGFTNATNYKCVKPKQFNENIAKCNAKHMINEAAVVVDDVEVLTPRGWPCCQTFCRGPEVGKMVKVNIVVAIA